MADTDLIERKNRAQGMVRSMDQWRNMAPRAVAEGSRAQVEYALIDAKHDIEMLWCALASLSQPAKGEREGGGQALVDADQNVASNEAAATPANPAQVTDALAICRTAAEEMIAANQQWRLDPRYIITICDALTAAIGAGGQAVESRKCAICGGPHDNDLLSDICQDCESSAPWCEDTHPAPSGQAVACKECDGTGFKDKNGARLTLARTPCGACAGSGYVPAAPQPKGEA